MSFQMEDVTQNSGVMDGGRVINNLYRILTDVVVNSYRKCFNLDSTNVPMKINVIGIGRAQTACMA